MKPLLPDLISGQNRYLQARHAVLTANLANADTPDYRPHDIRKPDFKALLERAGRRDTRPELRRTNDRHIQGLGIPAPMEDGRRVDGFEIAPAGNEVLIEEQALKLQETRLQFELTTAIYGKVSSMRRIARGSSGAGG